MDFTIIPLDHNTTVKLNGQFTFTDAHKFRNIIELVTEQKVPSLILDFSGVSFIDSAAMGMLLLLRDECNSRKIPVSIHSTHGQVEKIFVISKFDQLFPIYS